MAKPQESHSDSESDSFQDSLTDQERPLMKKSQKTDQAKPKLQPNKTSQEEEELLDSDNEHKQFRTTQQQTKYENYLKQQHQSSSKTSNQSRSASRRARRKRLQKDMESGKHMKTTSLEALEEADTNGELNQMTMFERIGPDSTAMDGPVTHARAMRGEIPTRGSNPNQPYMMQKQEKKESELDKQEGLKLKLEANLDIEIELRASIRGDLTLSLFA